MSDSLVQIRQLTKHYIRGKQTVEVLHGIDLDIPRGDFVALMGPSGSGKTTLLNLIGGLDTPTAGSVSVDGKRIDQFSGADLANSPAARNSASPSPAPWSPTRPCWSATNPQATSTARPPTRSWACCRS